MIRCRRRAIRSKGLRHGAALPATQRSSVRVRAATWPGTGTTRPGGGGGGHDKTQHAPRHDVVCVRPVRSLGHGWVHCTLDLVLTQDTVLSHCLDHCS